MQPDRVHENKIIIQTQFEEVEIPVRVTISPGFFGNFSPVLASFFLLTIPSIYFGLTEIFRYFIIKCAWDQVLFKFHLMKKGAEFLIRNKDYITRMTFDPGIIIFNKLYAFLIVLMAYFIPVTLGRIFEGFDPQVKKRVFPLLITSMVFPTLFLLLLLYLNQMPMEIITNNNMKYLDPERYLYFFIPMNILATLIAASPRDYNNQNFIDRNIFFKVVFQIIIITYFLSSCYFLVLR
jgi:hypothetical protein